MPIIEYTPQLLEVLRRSAHRMAPSLGLVHRSFVDYYYASRDWCKLYLFLAEDGSVLGTIGVDRMRFEYKSREITIGCGSNWYSLRPGVGALLFMYWLKSCPFGLVFTGSEDNLRIIRQQKWAFFPGIKGYLLNNPYRVYPGEAWWRKTAKWILRRTQRGTIPQYASRIPPETFAEISVREEHSYTQDLLPRRSPFSFRFAPSLDYLSWRYSTSLSFVRYRLFRVLARDTTIGYVIINESLEQLIVGQCDGEDATALAYGVLLSILQVALEDEKPRAVFLTCCHREMQRVYERFGFRAQRGDQPFALGSRRGKIDLSSDTSSWLINYDWGDNGLRAPFRDQSHRNLRVALDGHNVVYTQR